MHTIMYVSPFSGENKQFSSDSGQWSFVENTCPDGIAINLAPGQFAQSRLVADVCVGCRHSGSINFHPTDCKVRPEGIGIVLESPHRGEYSPQDITGTPLGPLIGSRGIFEENLGQVLTVIAESGVHLPDAPINLINAVQFQASLVALTRNHRFLRRVRTSMWNELYDHGGEDDLISRIEQYRPKLLILASTEAVRTRICRTFSRSDANRAPTVLITPHPSMWGRASISMISRWNTH